MFLISDVLTYMRRILKTPSNASITDNLLIDYVNRFYINDVDARIQLFDLKSKYQFITQPGVDSYNMPLYSMQTEQGGQSIFMYPVYQGFTSPCYINGIDVALQTQKSGFYNIWPNIVQQTNVVAVGDGGNEYDIQLPILPEVPPPNPPFNALIRGHVDITGIIATGVNQDPPMGTTINPLIPSTSIEARVFLTSLDEYGNNVVVTDSGQFLENSVPGASNYGLLMSPGPAPFGNQPLANGYSETSNTINYLTGTINVTFPVAIPAGNNINAQTFFFQSGLPRAILFYNNCLYLRSVPDSQYLVELDAFLSPAAFMSTTQALPFGYMSEYIARGAVRKILSDIGDVEQLNFYEPFFREQEMLVWKRSQRQWTATRTETIYSQGLDHGLAGNTNFSGGTI